MKTKMLSRARELWAHDLSDPATARYNMTHWARAIRVLGPRWVLFEVRTAEELKARLRRLG